MKRPVSKYELTFEPRPGYLRAHLKAEWIDAATAMAFNREMSAKCDEFDRDKLLVIREIPMMMDTLDIFDVTNDFIIVMRGRKVAYVNTHPAIARDFEFIVDVATNRGGTLNVFASEQDAEAWLLG